MVKRLLRLLDLRVLRDISDLILSLGLLDLADLTLGVRLLSGLGVWLLSGVGVRLLCGLADRLLS